MANKKEWSYDDFKYDDFKEPEEFKYDDFKYDDYKESDSVKNAGTALNNHLANKPAKYQSQWQTQLDSLMDGIMNREKFSYDLNGDALYQQYKDKYIQQGKMAMGDAIGQASAMTGGYGNSYAQSVGQQQYQAQLENLNDIVPQLYQMALDKYNMDGQELYNQYGLVADRENTDYGRYRDTVSDYLTERDYLQGRYDSERDYDYSKYNNERNFAYGQYSDDRSFEYGKWADDRTFDYNKYSADRSLAYDEYATDKNLSYQDYRNAIADEQWQKQYEESIRQFNESMAEDKRQFNEQMSFSREQYEEAKKSSGGSGGSGGGSGSGNAALQHVASMSSAEIVECMQSYQADGDNTGLAAFLDDCVASGRLTAEQADQYYEKYRTGGKDGKIDTTVQTVTPVRTSYASGGTGGKYNMITLN